MYTYNCKIMLNVAIKDMYIIYILFYKRAVGLLGDTLFYGFHYL